MHRNSYNASISSKLSSAASEKSLSQFRGWAEVFDNASMEQRKMIVCQLVKEINVSRGYKMDIVLDLNYEQFLAAS